MPPRKGVKKAAGDETQESKKENTDESGKQSTAASPSAAKGGGGAFLNLLANKVAEELSKGPTLVRDNSNGSKGDMEELPGGIPDTIEEEEDPTSGGATNTRKQKYLEYRKNDYRSRNQDSIAEAFANSKQYNAKEIAAMMTGGAAVAAAASKKADRAGGGEEGGSGNKSKKSKTESSNSNSNSSKKNSQKNVGEGSDAEQAAAAAAANAEQATGRAQRREESIMSQKVGGEKKDGGGNFKKAKNLISSVVAETKLVEEEKVKPITEREMKEMRALAIELGIDLDLENDREDFEKLLRQMVNEELPDNWVRELDPDLNIVYYDRIGGIATHRHPMVHNYRQIFYSVLEKKLEEPSDEEETTEKKTKRRTTALSKVVGSMRKTSIFSQQTSMLKRKASIAANIEEVKTEKAEEIKMARFFEEGKSKERFKTLRKVLRTQARQVREALVRKRNELHGLPDAQEFENVTIEAYFYYAEKYELSPSEIKLAIEESRSYRREDPDEVVDAIIYLGMADFDTSLYWLARAYLSLELPEGWTCTHADLERGKLYHNYLENVAMYQHPSWLYILHLVEIAMQEVGIDEGSSYNEPVKRVPGKESKVMAFEDLLGRTSEVDIGELLYTKMQLVRGSEQMPLWSDISRLAVELDTANRNVLKKRIEKFTTVDDKSDRPDLQVLYRRRRGHQRMPSNFRDSHMFALFEQLGLARNFPQNVHMTALVAEFVFWKEEEEKNNVWRFRQLVGATDDVDNGTPPQNYWLNKRQGEMARSYPYLKQLKKLADLFQKSVSREIELKRLNFKDDPLHPYRELLSVSSERELVKVVRLVRREARELILEYVTENTKDGLFVLESARGEEGSAPAATEPAAGTKQNEENGGATGDEKKKGKRGSIMETADETTATDTGETSSNKQATTNNNNKAAKGGGGGEDERGAAAAAAEEGNEDSASMLMDEGREFAVKGAYRLKYLMEYLRAEVDLDDNILREQLLFYCPYDLKKKVIGVPENTIAMQMSGETNSARRIGGGLTFEEEEEENDELFTRPNNILYDKKSFFETDFLNTQYRIPSDNEGEAPGEGKPRLGKSSRNIKIDESTRRLFGFRMHQNRPANAYNDTPTSKLVHYRKDTFQNSMEGGASWSSSLNSEEEQEEKQKLEKERIQNSNDDEDYNDNSPANNDLEDDDRGEEEYEEDQSENRKSDEVLQGNMDVQETPRQKKETPMQKSSSSGGTEQMSGSQFMMGSQLKWQVPAQEESLPVIPSPDRVQEQAGLKLQEEQRPRTNNSTREIVAVPAGDMSTSIQPVLTESKNNTTPAASKGPDLSSQNLIESIALHSKVGAQRGKERAEGSITEELKQGEEEVSGKLPPGNDPGQKGKAQEEEMKESTNATNSMRVSNPGKNSVMQNSGIQKNLSAMKKMDENKNEPLADDDNESQGIVDNKLGKNIVVPEKEKGAAEEHIGEKFKQKSQSTRVPSVTQAQSDSARGSISSTQHEEHSAAKNRETSFPEEKKDPEHQTESMTGEKRGSKTISLKKKANPRTREQIRNMIAERLWGDDSLFDSSLDSEDSESDEKEPKTLLELGKQEEGEVLEETDTKLTQEILAPLHTREKSESSSKASDKVSVEKLKDEGGKEQLTEKVIAVSEEELKKVATNMISPLEDSVLDKNKDGGATETISGKKKDKEKPKSLHEKLARVDEKMAKALKKAEKEHLKLQKIDSAKNELAEREKELQELVETEAERNEEILKELVALQRAREELHSEEQHIQTQAEKMEKVLGEVKNLKAASEKAKEANNVTQKFLSKNFNTTIETLIEILLETTNKIFLI